MAFAAGRRDRKDLADVKVNQVTCINNMLGQAASLGCSANDAKCLCQNQNFIFGVRDCSYQHCQNDSNAGTTVSYGTEYCKRELRRLILGS